MWGLKEKEYYKKEIDVEHEKGFNANTHQEMQIRTTVGQQTPPRGRLDVKSEIAKVREYLRLWGLGKSWMESELVSRLCRGVWFVYGSDILRFSGIQWTEMCARVCPRHARSRQLSAAHPPNWKQPERPLAAEGLDKLCRHRQRETRHRGEERYNRPPPLGQTPHT